MSRRDAYTLGVVGVLATVAAFWFLILGPKRSELAEQDEKVATAQSEVQAARQEVAQFTQARREFPTDYATVARLGKAVPVDPDMPSLVVQLDRAADRAKVFFLSLKVDEDAAEGNASPPASPAPGAQSSDTGTGTTGASGATGTAGTGTTGAQGSTAPANATAASSLPSGAEVGSAALSTTKLNLVFQGNFFRMADFIHNIRSLVQRRNRQLFVSGRLVTIDGISLGPGSKGFPQIKASMAVRSYLVPQAQGLFAGATVQGPGGATPTTPAPPSSPSAGSSPPAAVVTPR
jgi:hypothetical protein